MIRKLECLSFGETLHLFLSGDYPPAMRATVDKKSKDEGRSTSRLPRFNEYERQMLIGALTMTPLNNEDTFFRKDWSTLSSEQRRDMVLVFADDTSATTKTCCLPTSITKISSSLVSWAQTFRMVPITESHVPQCPPSNNPASIPIKVARHWQLEVSKLSKQNFMNGSCDVWSGPTRLTSIYYVQVKLWRTPWILIFFSPFEWKKISTIFTPNHMVIRGNTISLLPSDLTDTFLHSLNLWDRSRGTLLQVPWISWVSTTTTRSSSAHFEKESRSWFTFE